MKNKIILVDNKKYKLKKADMHPQDINWENLNINKKSKIKRRILSYLLIFIFLFSYYLLVTIISAYQNTFQRKYNLLTDCSNVDYKNIMNIKILIKMRKKRYIFIAFVQIIQKQ